MDWATFLTVNFVERAQNTSGPIIDATERRDGQAGAGAPQLTRTEDKQASPLVSGLWVVKEKTDQDSAAISQ